MKLKIFYLFALVLTSCQGQNTLSTNSTKAMDSTTKYNDLTPQQEQVLVNKATDRPYTGDYYEKKTMDCISAVVAIIHFTHQKINLIRIVDGQVLMMK